MGNQGYITVNIYQAPYYVSPWESLDEKSMIDPQAVWEFFW